MSWDLPDLNSQFRIAGPVESNVLKLRLMPPWEGQLCAIDYLYPVCDRALIRRALPGGVPQHGQVNPCPVLVQTLMVSASRDRVAALYYTYRYQHQLSDGQQAAQRVTPAGCGAGDICRVPVRELSRRQQSAHPNALLEGHLRQTAPHCGP